MVAKEFIEELSEGELDYICHDPEENSASRMYKIKDAVIHNAIKCDMLFRSGNRCEHKSTVQRCVLPPSSG
jgi:hypothetical protein